MNTHARKTSGIRAGSLAALVMGAALTTPAHAGGYYGPRNTIPVEPLAVVEQTCGGVFAPAWARPRARFEKVKDLGACPVRTVDRWIGPRAAIPLYQN